MFKYMRHTKVLHSVAREIHMMFYAFSSALRFSFACQTLRMTLDREKETK